jgi:hypothetical protein
MDGELQAILKVKDEFTQGIRENDFLQRRHIFTEDVSADYSNTGKAQGIEAVIKILSCHRPESACLKQNVENVITGYMGKNARQSFHMIMLYGLYDENAQFHYMQYGGTYVLSYKKTGDSWKISGILYDLCWLEGNSYWVKDWKMIDFHMPKTHAPVINCIRDGVVRCIPENEAVLTDKEAIEETLYLYAWGIDTEDYGIFRERALPDLVVEDGYHGRIFSGNETWIEFIRSLNEKEPCLHHTYRVTDIQIDGSTATARMSRLEPNRIGSKVINRDNYFFDWFTLDYNVELVKDNCVWKLKRVSFIKNVRCSLTVKG